MKERGGNVNNLSTLSRVCCSVCCSVRCSVSCVNRPRSHIYGVFPPPPCSSFAVANGATSKVVEKFRDTGEGKWIATFFKSIEVFQVREGGGRRKEERVKKKEEGGRRKEGGRTKEE